MNIEANNPPAKKVPHIKKSSETLQYLQKGDSMPLIQDGISAGTIRSLKRAISTKSFCTKKIAKDKMKNKIKQ